MTRNTLYIILILALFSCKKSDPPAPSYQPTPYQIEIPFRFPTHLNIPDDNPMTVEGIELGRMLFYDGRISGRTDPDSMMCCATCHLQSRSFECGIDHPVYTGGHPFGVTGISTPHFMMPLINLVWTHTGYLWNGVIEEGNPDPSRRHLEDLVWMGIVAPHEMHSDTNQAKELIQRIPGYPQRFEQAFGSPVVTVKNMGKAIAQFVRTLISADSKFDQYLRGEVQLNPAELNGYILFVTEQGGDCFHCHGGEGNPLFTTNLFYNNGKDSVFTDPRDRYQVTGNPNDIGAYKAPTLRNLLFTAPYMHDGRFRTIDEVLDFYSSGLVWSPYINPLMHHISTNGNQLTPAEKADLKAFLLTLTDSTFVTNPEFGMPDLP
ncbi:MAG: cytochrome-c peroxidase [Bacteroidetes bacterium]|nr:MAG: cytochrome-c peroxidase [Bacteroidota bacterium]